MALYEGLFGQSGIYLDVYAVRIDIYGSLAVVGQPLNAGGNQYTCLVYGAKKCFKAAAAAGDIITAVNKGRWAGPMSSLLLLYVYGCTTSRTNLCEKFKFSQKF